jgi:hypothetical protein
MSAISTIEPSQIESLATRGRPCMCGGRQVTAVPTATLDAYLSTRSAKLVGGARVARTHSVGGWCLLWLVRARVDYLKDVLTGLPTQRASEISQLLPHK